MEIKKIDILERALARERAARKLAESILEHKSKELYETSLQLKKANFELEHLLDEKSSELQGVFENINDAYVVMDLMGNIIKLNDIATHLFEHNTDDGLLNAKNLIYKEDYKYAIASFLKLKKEGYFSNYEARIITKSKQVKWVHINASVIFNKEKKPIAAQGIIRDITKEKKEAQKLIDSENRLATLILNLESGVLLESEDRKIVLTNTKFCNLFSIPVAPEFLVGQDCSEAASQSKHLFENPEAFVTRINEILIAKIPVIADELKMVNGTVLERDFVPIFEADKYKGHLWSYRDITLNRKYRLSIEAEKQKYSNIIANMNLGLLEVDLEDRILMVNQNFCEISGYKEAELLGKCANQLFPVKGDDQKILLENDRRKKGESNSYEIKVKNKKGELKHWLISGAPNYNIQGEVIGSIGIHLDITNIKQLELQKENLLKELEKSNNELHEYAHIVSHDLKSPLRSINALVNWIKTDNEGLLDQDSLRNFELIDTTLEKMEQLITDILNYSSLGSSIRKKKQVDTLEIVEDLEKILFIPSHIKLNISTALPQVLGDKTKISQLFQNLISNAVKFSDKKEGLITISAKEKEKHYEFCVKDNGIGIDKKYHNSIFKIFHSLKKSNDSSGIGLSIVKKIVDLHDGEVWLESEPQQGTSFYFTLSKK